VAPAPAAPDAEPASDTYAAKWDIQRLYFMQFSSTHSIENPDAIPCLAGRLCLAAQDTIHDKLMRTALESLDRNKAVLPFTQDILETVHHQVPVTIQPCC